MQGQKAKRLLRLERTFDIEIGFVKEILLDIHVELLNVHVLKGYVQLETVNNSAALPEVSAILGSPYFSRKGITITSI